MTVEDLSSIQRERKSNYRGERQKNDGEPECRGYVMYIRVFTIASWYMDRETYTHSLSPTHTGDMVSASDNSSGAAEPTKPPPGSLKVTCRRAAAGTAVSQPIADLNLLV